MAVLANLAVCAWVPEIEQAGGLDPTVQLLRHGPSLEARSAAAFAIHVMVSSASRSSLSGEAVRQREPRDQRPGDHPTTAVHAKVAALGGIEELVRLLEVTAA